MTDQAANTEETKLYAGKFKSVEDLENGYKNSLPVLQENEQLKAKLEEAIRVPDTYQNPAEIAVGIDANRIADIQARAKDAGMTQKQYEKFLNNEKARLDRGQQGFENARKEVGEETLNMLQDYVKNHYPASLVDGVLKTLITNKEARSEAMAHRARLLGDQVPGVGQPAFTKYNVVTDEDVRKAYLAKDKSPHDMKARQRYINLIEQQAAQKNAS
jgi:hypothetical protein